MLSVLGRLALVFLATHQFFTNGKKMDRFSNDLMRGLANIEPVLILNPDEQDILSEWTELQTAVLVSATGLPEESDIIINQLETLIEEGNVDYIFFGTGSSNVETIRTVVNSLQILMDNKITVVIPHEYFIGIQMRLDSRLFLYEDTSEGIITLYESYQIR